MTPQHNRVLTLARRPSGSLAQAVEEPVVKGILLLRGFHHAFFTDPGALPRLESALRKHGKVESTVLLPGFKAARVR
jgi:hypothetical protein